MPKNKVSIDKVEEHIKKKINNDPDINFKKISFFDYEIMMIFSESVSSRDIIDNLILKYFSQKFLIDRKNIKDIIPFLANNIPARKMIKINNYDEIFYYIFNGFIIILVDGEEEILAFEARSSLNSNIDIAKNETVIKGPQDAFAENYQINLGMVRRRIKSENLWSEELTVGRLSKTKVSILYMNEIASKELVKIVVDKIKKIDIDAIIDSNYIIENISDTHSHPFPNYLYTERPDMVTMKLLEGKIVIIVENSRLAIIIPMVFSELFHSPEDYYQKVINTNYTRIIRLLAFFVTILTPAFYIALTTYNHEAIPSKLIVNFSIQRDGVPFPSILEALLMLIIFDILKETDTRIPNVIGSSLSIVGALVLGEAAVSAGVVSPIMVIVIAITSISNFILSYLDAINGIRWWRILFLLLSATAGIIGITVAGLIFVIDLVSMSSLGVPYLTPLSPLIKNDLGDNVLLSDKSRFFKRPSYIAHNNAVKGRRIKK